MLSHTSDGTSIGNTSSSSDWNSENNQQMQLDPAPSSFEHTNAKFTFHVPAPQSEKFPDLIMDESWDQPEKPEYVPEPLLIPAKKRFVLFPIKFQSIWQTYKHAESKFWTAEEIELFDDYDGWEGISRRDRSFLLQILALLSKYDKLIGEDILNRFSDEIQSPEARCMFGFQIMQKNIHTELYCVIVELFSQETIDRSLAYDIIKEFPSVPQIKAWVQRYLIENDDHYCFRIVALAIYSSVFLSSTNACLLHLTATNPYPLPGVIRTVAKVYRDHQLYNDFYRAVFKTLLNKPTKAVIHQMTLDAVTIEHKLIDDLFTNRPAVSLPGCEIQADDLKRYIETVANKCLGSFEIEPVYSHSNSVEKLAWIDRVLDEELRKDESEVMGVIGFGDHPNLPSNISINVRQEFSLDEDF